MKLYYFLRYYKYKKHTKKTIKYKNTLKKIKKIYLKTQKNGESRYKSNQILYLNPIASTPRPFASVRETTLEVPRSCLAG